MSDQVLLSVDASMSTSRQNSPIAGAVRIQLVVRDAAASNINRHVGVVTGYVPAVQHQETLCAPEIPPG